MDQTPEQILRMGIGSGQWQFALNPRFLDKMEPERNDEKTRVLACIEYHTQGRRRLAMRMDEKTKTLVPLQPEDIANFLNDLDPEKRIGKTHLARTLSKLQEEGRLRLPSRTRRNYRIYYYAKPQVRANQNLVTKCGNQIPVTHSNYEEIAVCNFRKQFVKDVFAGVKAQFPDLVTISGNQIELENLLAEADLVIRSVYQKAILVIKSANQNSADFDEQPEQNESDTAKGPRRAFSSSSQVEEILKAEEEEESRPPRALAKTPPAPPEFEHFRKCYPPNRLDAGKARPVWNALSDEDKRGCFAGLLTHIGCERWVRSLANDHGRFVPLASNFIKRGEWREEPPPYLSPKLNPAEQMHKDRADNMAASARKLFEKLSRG